MHAALVRSLNLPSVERLNKVGPDQAAAWARRLGFTTPIHADKALASGASCVRTDELTRAFATFARGGGPPKLDSKTVRIYFRPGSYNPPKEEGAGPGGAS